MAETFRQRTFSTVKKCIASRKELVPRGGAQLSRNFKKIIEG
jgi:hypothetical protein